MAIITSDLLQGILTNFRTLFGDDFLATLAVEGWTELAMPIDSNARIESYNWLGTVPRMNDVTRGEIILEDPGHFNFSIENRLFKAGFEVERQDLEDDRLSQIMPRVRQLGPEAARHPGELIFKLFEDNGLAFDGVAFFANTRVIGSSGNVDNLIAGTGITVAQFQADLATARATMERFQDDKGRPAGKHGNVIVVPPELAQLAFQALNAAQTPLNQPVRPADGGITRTIGYTVVSNPFLTDVNDWYLLSVAGAIKPFILQKRVAPTLEGTTNPNDRRVQETDRFLYSVRARYAAGYGDPRHAVKVVNS